MYKGIYFFRYLQLSCPCRGGTSALNPKILNGILHQYEAHFKELQETNISTQTRVLCDSQFPSNSTINKFFSFVTSPLIQFFIEIDIDNALVHFCVFIPFDMVHLNEDKDELILCTS